MTLEKSLFVLHVVSALSAHSANSVGERHEARMRRSTQRRSPQLHILHSYFRLIFQVIKHDTSLADDLNTVAVLVMNKR